MVQNSKKRNKFLALFLICSNSSEAPNWVGKKKKWTKKKGKTTTTNFIPGQTIHFLVEVFAFLSFFQPLKTFSYVFHFHNLSKIHSEKTIFAKKFFWKKKKIKKKFFIFFFFNFFFFNFFFFQFFFFRIVFRFFFLCPKPQHIFLSILLVVIHLLPIKKKDKKKRFARPSTF